MDDEELEKIRAKRKAELLKAMETKQKQMEIEKSEENKKRVLEERKQQLLQQLLMPDALLYFRKIRQNDASLARKIEDTIMVMYVNHLIDERLTLVDVKALERRYTGQDSSIRVKRRGQDAKSLSEEITDK
jgi:DNA-binding TFAR19-related protein (PDSD5 family)